ncbi:20062_t:CDS:1 [Funneliformis geosporum]|uniref:19943_t:CDS:1 n=1 Tax=Funneliformis geosporum TaxID=1117311 RepID=A0A9W4WWP4_9GLOM|nr:20062_t:CDS:1 [Funneliformis geosporum]CAI2177809.1 19943_t:CDS:1 [Funneliformis geosporum]
MKITVNIVDALDKIHCEDTIHSDLHSGNILFSQLIDLWLISNLGFYGSAIKLHLWEPPYIAPEIIDGKEYIKASDVYNLAMLMWEIASGKTPFNECENDYELAMNIVNGMRPKIESGIIPLEYKNLM